MNEDSSLFLLAEVALIHNTNRTANICCEKRKTLKNKELKITYQNGENLVDLNDLKNLPSGILFNIFVEKCHIEDYLNVVYVCKFGVQKSCDTRFSDNTRDDKLRKLKHVIQCHLLQHLLETKADTLVKIPSKSIGFVKAKFPITENISIANQPLSLPFDKLNFRQCVSQKPSRAIPSTEQPLSAFNDTFIEIVSPEDVSESSVDNKRSLVINSSHPSYSTYSITEDESSNEETRLKENLEREVIAKQLIQMSESLDIIDSTNVLLEQSTPIIATQLTKLNSSSMENESKLSESVIDVVECTEEPSRSSSTKKVKNRPKKISNPANLMNNLEILMGIESTIEMEKKACENTYVSSSNGKKLATKNKSPEHVWDHSYATFKRKASSSPTSDGSATRIKNKRVNINNLYHLNSELSQELSHFMMSEALGCSETAVVGSEVEVTTKRECSHKFKEVSLKKDSVNGYPRPKKSTHKQDSVASVGKFNDETPPKQVDIVSVKQKLQPVIMAAEIGRNYAEKFINAKENCENDENSTEMDSSNILKKVLLKDFGVKRPTIITNVWNNVNVQYS